MTTIKLLYPDAVALFKRLALTTDARPTIPVLANALLDPVSQTICSSTLDEWTVAKLPLPFECDAPDAAYMVPVRLTGKLLRAVKPTGAKATRESWVAITTDGEKITVACNGRSVSDEFPGGPTEDFPALPAIDVTLVGEWYADEFGDGLAFVEHAVGKDATLPMLTCIRVEITEGHGPAFAATDRYRLAVIDLPGEAERDANLLIPHAAVKAIRALDGPIRLYAHDDNLRYGGAWAKFTDATTALWVRLSDSSFPAFRSLLPTGQRDEWTVDRARLLGDVKALAAALDKHTPVRVQFRPGEVRVGDCRPVPADTTPGDRSYTIGFNAAFLRDAVDAVRDVEVTVSIGAADRPVVFTAGVETGTSLLMPVRLPDAEAAA